MEKIFGIIQLISLGLFLGLVIGKTIYLKEKNKISAIKINIFSSEGRKHSFEIIMFLLVNLWTFGVLFYALNQSFNTFPALPQLRFFDILGLKITGLVLISTGFIFFIMALIELGNSWRLGIDDKNPGRLVTGGIYAITRHPIYIFFDLYFFGIFLLNSNLIFLIFAVVLSFSPSLSDHKGGKIFTKKVRKKI